MIVSVAQAQLFFLVVTRVLAMLIHVPVLGGQSIPTQVRLAFGLMLSAVLIPWQPLPPGAEAMGLFGFAVAIGKEVLLGTLAGFAAELTFAVIVIAGEAMGLESGFSSGRVFNPSMGESGSAFNQLFVMVAMMFFFIIDGHHIFLIAMQKTFEVIPVNGTLPLQSLDALIRMTAQLIAAGIQLALPVMAALIFTDVALGLLARVAPQVQIFFLGLPLKVGVSMAALGLLVTMVLPAVGNLYKMVGNRMLILLGK
ncbi:flagellar biosynthesis pathway, component FliR [Anaerolinea thermolimosa]|uniref:flagellar biosynthetic protein FliR n=1 Tax=Anaerolinea thermolimosa TaxID=229919 RepID=UPI0007867F32|nr:flagellar biosynthetic protein FliR [Anaerolinea thermolimosa]GAP07910.1 flagellar biosynthesis pathway, component FliR [Anaerolinea thermolimosa]